MKIDTHEIDTQARKIIPIALSRRWKFNVKMWTDSFPSGITCQNKWGHGLQDRFIL